MFTKSSYYRGKKSSWEAKIIRGCPRYQSISNQVETSRPRDMDPEPGSQYTCAGRSSTKEKVHDYLSLRNTTFSNPVGDSQYRFVHGAC